MRERQLLNIGFSSYFNRGTAFGFVFTLRAHEFMYYATRSKTNAQLNKLDLCNCANVSAWERVRSREFLGSQISGALTLRCIRKRSRLPVVHSNCQDLPNRFSSCCWNRRRISFVCMIVGRLFLCVCECASSQQNSMLIRGCDISTAMRFRR